MVELTDGFMKYEKDYAKKKAKLPQSMVPEACYDDFYAIPHTRTTLFADRSVQVRAGFAIVPLYKMESIFISEFREKLAKRMEVAHKHFPRVVASDMRMKELLMKMNDQYTGPDYAEHENRAMGGIKVSLA